MQGDPGEALRRGFNASLASNLANKTRKIALFLGTGFLIGLLDAVQAKDLRLWTYGRNAAISYQALLMILAGLATVWSLYDSRWSRSRNLISLVMAIPLATLADNVSYDLQTLKPYVVILPRTGYMWRLHAFNHTHLYPLARFVDAQTFAPGLIDGYVAAIAIAVGYILVQIFWARI